MMLGLSVYTGMRIFWFFSAWQLYPLIYLVNCVKPSACPLNGSHRS